MSLAAAQEFDPSPRPSASSHASSTEDIVVVAILVVHVEMDRGMFKVGAFTVNLTGDCNPELSGAVTAGNVHCHSCDMLVQHKADGMLGKSFSRCSRALGTVVLRPIQGLCCWLFVNHKHKHAHTSVSVCRKLGTNAALPQWSMASIGQSSHTVCTIA